MKKDLIREYGSAPRCRRVEDTKRGRRFHRLNVVGGLFGGRVVASLCYEYSTCGVFFEVGLWISFCLVCLLVLWLFWIGFLFIGGKICCLLLSGLVLICCFCLLILADFSSVECWWVNLKRVLPDLMFGCVTLQELCTLTLESVTLKLFHCIKEVGNKMFTPLFTTKSKGQGLCLAVVKRLTEALNGNITFEREAGKGTHSPLNTPNNLLNRHIKS